ncbi:iron transporter [Pseudochelatococcus contaminans]|nr:iron transporter [Pseudochelatococcus contaminans]
MVASAVFVGAALLGPMAQAAEFYVGEPVVKNFLQLSPAYLEGIEMDRHPPGMSMDPKAIHFEIDIHAAADEPHGFPEDAWIPYLNVELTIAKKGTNFSERKVLAPMQANDGPHYANNFNMDGPGEYTATYVISPPDLIRHVDKDTGVPAWWEPVTVSWTFQYPSKPND